MTELNHPIDFKQAEAKQWNALPDLDLYMDQVITLLTRELAPYIPEGETAITSNMINNYVKDGVLPRPDCKKYNRAHFTKLIALCQLKTVLAIPEADLLLNSLQSILGEEALYNHFTDLRKEALENLNREAESIGNDNHSLDLALNFALKSALYRTAATRIINDYQVAQSEALAAQKAEKEAQKAKAKAEKEATKKQKPKEKAD